MSEHLMTLENELSELISEIEQLEDRIGALNEQRLRVASEIMEERDSE